MLRLRRGRATVRLAILLLIALVVSGCTGLTWGGNTYGQLGNGSTTSSGVPTVLDPPAGEVWTVLEAGFDDTCGVSSMKDLWCWGRPYGNDPVMISNGWSSLSVGGSHTCGLQVDRTLWCWGANEAGALGDGTTTPRPDPTQVGSDADWVEVGASTRVVLGRAHTCAIKAGGTLWCWGGNEFGQLGDGTQESRLSPTQIGTDADWASINAGPARTCAVKADGSLWCWGYTGFFEPDIPRQIGTDTDWRKVDVSSGEWVAIPMFPEIIHVLFTCAIKVDGTLWCWGDNGSGRLGIGHQGGAGETPTQVGTESDWVAVTAGEQHACGIRLAAHARSLWCWGDNSEGQLGDGTTTDSWVPIEIATDGAVVSVDAGSMHNVIRTVGD